MFQGASAKLQDARTALDRLRALARPAIETNVRIVSTESVQQINPIGTDDPVGFSEAFSSCVAQIRAVGDAVLKDKSACRLAGFVEWRERKKRECQADELLRFINDRRNSDLHEGFSPLTFAMQAFAFSSDSTGGVPAPSATLLIDNTGPYWLVEQGTARERRVPCTLRQGFLVTVAVRDPPGTHKGKPLPSRDPVTLCEVAERFYAELVFEAKTRFVK